MKQKIYITLFVIFSLNSNAQSDTIKVSPTKENIAGTYNRTLTIDGIEREFIVYIPESASGKTEVPVVFMLHGLTGNGKKFHDRPFLWTAKAKKEGFIAIHPTALKHCFVYQGKTQNTTVWTIGNIRQPDKQSTCPDQIIADDMKFFDEMVLTIKNEYAVNQKRIYATGFSNGASMVARLAAERSDVFAAVAAHGAFISNSLSSNVTKRPMSMILSFGADDPILKRRLKTSVSVPVNANLISNPKFLESIQLYLDIQGINNHSVYSEKNYGEFKAGEFLFSNSIAGNNNTMKYIILENLNHDYPDTLADVFWDFFKGETLP